MTDVVLEQVEIRKEEIAYYPMIPTFFVFSPPFLVGFILDGNSVACYTLPSWRIHPPQFFLEISPMTKCPRLTKTTKVLGIAFPSGLLPIPTGEPVTMLGVAACDCPGGIVLAGTSKDFADFATSRDDEGSKKWLAGFLSWCGAKRVVINLPTIQKLGRPLTPEEKVSRRTCKALAANITAWLRNRPMTGHPRRGISVQRTIFRDDSLNAEGIALSWRPPDAAAESKARMRAAARKCLRTWHKKRLAKAYEKIDAKLASGITTPLTSPPPSGILPPVDGT